uniref:Salivary lipocalin 5 n=1 Tax=Dipetalogaster maximus TaxID=72496 RepID=G3CJR4_DIPMA
MKTFIALTFIGILTYAHGASECKTPTPVVQDFKATDFHSGTWYVTHVANETEPTDCRTLSMSTTTSGNSKTFVVQHPYGEGDKDKLHCTAQPETEKRLTFTCKSGGKVTDTTIFIAMVTDYNDYALYYLCTTVKSGSNEGKVYDNYLVARRDGSKKDIPAALKTYTNNLGLKSC